MYTVKYHDYIICNNVDKSCAKAVCQLLMFLMTIVKEIDICIADIKICWTEPSVQKETDIPNFILD